MVSVESADLWLMLHLPSFRDFIIRFRSYIRGAAKQSAHASESNISTAEDQHRDHHPPLRAKGQSYPEAPQYFPSHQAVLPLGLLS